MSIVAACVHAYTNASRLGETRGKAVFAGRSVRSIGELVLQGMYANVLIIFSFNDVYMKQFQRLYRFKCEGKFNMYVVL